MEKYLVWLTILSLVFLGVEPHSHVAQRCLSTLGRHKDSPSREPGLHECHLFSENACCEPSTTRSLADSSGMHIDTFYWTKCGNVSEECEAYIKAEMCFYYCSPNTYPWARRIIPSTVVHPEDIGETYVGVPICSSWCDDFFNACRDQPICVTNWYTDWNVTYNPVRNRNESHCTAASTCQTFAQRFGTAQGMCNRIFDTSYIYTTSNDCLVMSFNDSSGNPNDAVAARLASGATALHGSMLVGMGSLLLTWLSAIVLS